MLGLKHALIALVIALPTLDAGAQTQNVPPAQTMRPSPDASAPDVATQGVRGGPGGRAESGTGDASGGSPKDAKQAPGTEPTKSAPDPK